MVLSEIVCPDGRWGPGCKEKCRCANGARCDPSTGECKCNLGYTGTTCEESCPSGKYGLNCTLDCECHGSARCDPVQGCCDCPRGRYGTRCQFVCPAGFYGWYCSQSCSCQNGASCDPADGQCLCPPGFEGDHCESSCKNFTYGPHCQLQCDCGEHPCSPKDGTCLCPVGLSGSKCQQELTPLLQHVAKDDMVRTASINVSATTEQLVIERLANALARQGIWVLHANTKSEIRIAWRNEVTCQKIGNGALVARSRY
ncbi:EGF-like domain protein [Dictyocaulus viviparus]|uniref:EGF-like domain protein n=1 Tax=Dictyocaulus viviparus TaxID=29172 RepID=A0A0D8XG02_DICVI|nr:EGF-like domain protein [Dictyocaulus viviparus]